ncbi:hypothetical protein LSAT2_027995 [Lamellibrachia satsuma]|nr:hypothetical protein LSAT2_027995 [Lamellibrachia satsuma]
MEMKVPNTTSRGSSYTTDYRVSGTRPGPGGGGGGGGGRPQRRMGGFRGGPGTVVGESVDDELVIVQGSTLTLACDK